MDKVTLRVLGQEEIRRLANAICIGCAFHPTADGFEESACTGCQGIFKARQRLWERYSLKLPPTQVWTYDATNNVLERVKPLTFWAKARQFAGDICAMWKARRKMWRAEVV